jgi:hypothetical protein
MEEFGNFEKRNLVDFLQEEFAEDLARLYKRLKVDKLTLPVEKYTMFTPLYFYQIQNWISESKKLLDQEKYAFLNKLSDYDLTELLHLYWQSKKTVIEKGDKPIQVTQQLLAGLLKKLKISFEELENIDFDDLNDLNLFVGFKGPTTRNLQFNQILWHDIRDHLQNGQALSPASDIITSVGDNIHKFWRPEFSFIDYMRFFYFSTLNSNSNKTTVFSA